MRQTLGLFGAGFFIGESTRAEGGKVHSISLSHLCLCRTQEDLYLFKLSTTITAHNVRAEPSVNQA